ncbi:uncharacterized protein BP5553_03832 [Venustampulla echinocandica]|uniref:DUF4604 domain-containing protein n=1 Tax=Venustampulla echinocandica TaxID=2656787 RepID=A0A370TVC2_9HELO|nr:uncharacterized protein BP5553_03832 [Venustampulla echinocandica]RDL39492.1 hypothetical protein BP5553_03832 [Venustampulla echinocandica]
MSKINAKNLSYDNSLPPFLARLQAANSTSDGRQEFHIARPKKARTADEEAEDDPVYFDERTGETLTKAEWEERESKADGDEDEDDKNTGKDDKGVEDGAAQGLKDGEKVKVASIGASKKRKLGKIVGVSEEAEEDDEDQSRNKERGPSTKTKALKAAESEAAGKKKPTIKGKSAKKGKKIKLSFGDEE